MVQTINITFPIFDNRDSALGALTVPYIEHVDSKVTRSAVVAALRKSAEEISSTLGGSVET